MYKYYCAQTRISQMLQAFEKFVRVQKITSIKNLYISTKWNFECTRFYDSMTCNFKNFETLSMIIEKELDTNKINHDNLTQTHKMLSLRIFTMVMSLMAHLSLVVIHALHRLDLRAVVFRLA